MSKLLSTLPVGALVKDTGTTYNGETPVFRVLEHGHTGDPSGSTTLEFRDVISFKSFDAKESSNPNSYMVNYGNARYVYSNLLQWLNSSGAAGEWYLAQHEYDQSPNSKSVVQDNVYSSEAGFLTNFSSDLKDKLLTVSKTTSTNSGSSAYESVQSKLFLLSLSEIGLTDTMDPKTEGSIYSYYSQGTISENTNDRAIKNPTTAAVNNSDYKGTTGDLIVTGQPIWWWLRSPSYSYYDTQGVCVIARNGGKSTPSAYSVRGISPAFCISSSTLVSDDPDSSGVYTLILEESHDDRIINVGNLRTFKENMEDVVDDKIEEAVVQNSFYGTCDTEADVSAKVVTLSNASGWKFKAGTIIGVKFSVSNTASDVTLNVNGSGNKSIYYDGAVYTAANTGICGAANRVTYYMYDGTYWVWLNMGKLDGNTDTKVSQTVTTTDATYEVLFSVSTGNTTKTEGARKNNNLTFNPSAGNLGVIKINGVVVGNSPKFTDTTYSDATTSAAGLMSSTDKAKLDGIGSISTSFIDNLFT